MIWPFNKFRRERFCRFEGSEIDELEFELWCIKNNIRLQRILVGSYGRPVISFHHLRMEYNEEERVLLLLAWGGKLTEVKDDPAWSSI